jgi:Na+/proline symporter
MSFNVSEGAAYAVLFSVLVIFALMAFASADYFPCLPRAVRNCFQLKIHEHEILHSADYFLSARNSAGYFAIALSFFSTGMGAWVVYGTTEMGATPQLSWLGVLGYSGASAFPAILICWLGPKIRDMSQDAFSTADFGRKRYGRVMQVTIAVVSVFYMFIFIVSELTSISNVYALLTNQFQEVYGIIVTVALGSFTLFYTGLAGLPASLVTDKLQGLIMAVLAVMLTIAVTVEPSNRVNKEEFALASNWTADGGMAAVTLIIAIASAEMFNQATWQRVWAAEDVPALRKGFLLGSLLVFLLMMFFGVMGMIAYANDPEAYDSGEKWAYLAFFDLLEPLANGWHILVLILVTALAASSIDSLQNGLTCIFSADLVRIGWNPKLFTRILIVCMNAPAIYLASKKFDVISLFLVADLVCATSVLPTFLGLQVNDMKFLKAPTELGAFLGCLSGLATVVINGLVNNAAGGIFGYFWLPNNAICALCGPKTMVSFILTPCISAIMTYVFSYLDIMIRGERARMPLIPLPFDKNDLDRTSKPDISSEEDAEENVVEHDGSVYAADFEGNTTVFDQSTAAPEHAIQTEDCLNISVQTEDRLNISVPAQY